MRPQGYALVGIPGVRSRCVGLHRLVYCEHNDCTLDDIKGQVIRHTCDNPRCINPKHLLIGTLADNNRDRAERNRSAKVVPSRQTITDEQIKYIRNNYVKGSRTNGLRYFADRFEIDLAYIQRIVTNKVRV